jgi:hypothetical protein
MKLYIGEVRVKATRKGVAMDKGKCNCGAWLCHVGDRTMLQSCTDHLLRVYRLSSIIPKQNERVGAVGVVVASWREPSLVKPLPSPPSQRPSCPS